MTVVRVGTTKQYADNWDIIFGGSNGRATSKTKTAKVAKPARQSAKKKPGKKKAAPRTVKKARKKK
jgi:hypothetical protein